MKESKLTASHVLLPLSLVSLVLLLLISFETTQILRERDALHQAKAQQNAPLEDANRVQAQFSALALGTKKLADDGDKEAAALVERMKKLGVVFNAPAAAPGVAEGAATPTPVKQ